MPPRARWGGFTLAVWLYGCSLSLPAAKVLRTTGWLGEVSGLDVLTTVHKFPELLTEEPLDATLISFVASWCANPAIWLMILALGLNRVRFAAWLSGIATLLTFSFLPFWGSSVAFQPGYWCWCLAAVTGLVTVWISRLAATQNDLHSDYGPIPVTPPEVKG